MTTTTQARPRKAATAPHGTCRLTLTINGTAYAVKPVACDPGAALRCFELRKGDGTRYHSSQHEHGAECDCPDFVFHRDGLDPAGCKHVRALVACGMLDDSPADEGDLASWPAWTDDNRYTVAR
jgi:hypothetical protein